MQFFQLMIPGAWFVCAAAAADTAPDAIIIAVIPYHCPIGYLSPVNAIPHICNFFTLTHF